MQLRWLWEQWAVALISWTEGSKPGERAEVRQSPVAQQQNTPYNCERSPAKQPITNKKTDSTLGFTAELPFRSDLIWTTYSGDLQKRQMSRRGLKSVMYESEKPPCVWALTETVHLKHMHTQHTHTPGEYAGGQREWGRGSGGWYKASLKYKHRAPLSHFNMAEAAAWVRLIHSGLVGTAIIWVSVLSRVDRLLTVQWRD